ncbi:uncharacterized protein F5147DRAFT_776915 [Suillus discolor]|uniref:Secreted protein n=1 Tax=Suillus discolor TaxID=1912936 RepID=A0A9P7F250_9AGAM|nr:uncharacterized protein F5147DRAFT_776915 [Suillus discolor]KAG2100711.1 hypothetical protein F5147DRAFT_776915 [Suillus discolor]
MTIISNISQSTIPLICLVIVVHHCLSTCLIKPAPTAGPSQLASLAWVSPAEEKEEHEHEHENKDEDEGGAYDCNYYDDY